MTTSLLTRARMALLGVPEKEITAFKRGDSADWRHLESAVRAAITGYHAVLEGGGLDQIVARLDRVPAERRGFAYEGAAMGFTGLDCLFPRKARFREYVTGPGAGHIYMLHIGAGEALARLRRRPEPFMARIDDPVLRWLVIDGYGFHQGFFARPRYVDRQAVPRHLSTYARRVFDQGVGRSIWFTAGADVGRIAAHLAAFPVARQPALWLGVGIACSYVGGLRRDQIERLREASGPHLPMVAAGAAFAAAGRHRAGNSVLDTNLACEVLCGTSSFDAAGIVDDAFASLPTHFDQPGYELLQSRVLDAFGASRVPADAGSSRWT